MSARKTALIVVCAVAGVFVVIIAPAVFLPYCLTVHSRTTQDEAREALGALGRAEEAYRARTGCYATDLSALGEIPPAPEGYEMGVLAADCSGFVARTWANLDSDPRLDVWEVSETSPEPACLSDDLSIRGKPVDPRALPERYL